MTLVASALAGGDCIDDADALRTGGTASALGCVVKAPSTLGTFLRSFRWGQVRQLDRVGRELLARAWAAGAGPGDVPLTIDLDSTICETYGLAKAGARHHGYTGQRGYHPLLAIAAGTGDVLMSRLREGRASTVRRAAHFLRETVGRVALRRGQRTTHGARRQRLLCSRLGRRLPRNGCPLLHHRPAARPPAQYHRGDTRGDWRPILYWMDGAAAVAETTYTPFQSEPDAAPVRLIVRRVKPTPGSQLALFAAYSYHGFITDRDGDTLGLEADHRRHAEIENAIRDLKHSVGLNHLPSGRFAANPEPAEGGLAGRPGDRPQPGTLDGAHRSGRATGNHQNPATTLLLPRRTAHPFGAPPHFASSPALALGKPVQSRPGTIASLAISCLTAPVCH